MAVALGLGQLDARTELALLAGFAFLGAGGLGVGFIGSGVASAASANQAVPGVPGTPNCDGQTLAFLARGNFVAPGPGIGNYSRQVSLTVQEVQEGVQTFCATGIVS